MPSIHLSRKIKRLSQIKLDNGSVVEVCLRVRHCVTPSENEAVDKSSSTPTTHHDKEAS